MAESETQDHKIVKVMLGIPNEGHTEVEAYDDRLATTFHLGALQALSQYGQTELCGMKFNYPEGIKFEFHQGIIGKVLTPLARERLCERAVEHGMDYIYMIDDDMMCPIDMFERLYAHQKDIIAPLAFSRYGPHKPVIYTLKSGYDVFLRQHYYVNLPVMNYPKDQLVQCDAVGFGAVLFKTSVLKDIPKPWFMTTSGAGEDVHFCHSAGKAGYKIFVDTSVKLGHLSSPAIITEQTYEAQEAAKAKEKNNAGNG